MSITHYFSKDKDKKCSGLDPACRTGNQPFYIPCTHSETDDSSFFTKCGLDRTRDIEKNGIDPALYVKTSVIPFERPVVRSVSRVNRTDIDIDQKINDIKSEVTMLTESRRLPFYHAGIDLKKLGLSYSEIESHLTDLAFSIGKSNTRWVSDAMKSLKFYKHGFNRVSA